MYPFWIIPMMVFHCPMIIDNDFNCFMAFCCEWWIGFSSSVKNAKQKGQLGKKTNHKYWESIILPHM